LNSLPVVLEDNKAVIQLAKTEESKTLKHLVIFSFHYVRRLTLNRCIVIKMDQHR